MISYEPLPSPAERRGSDGDAAIAGDVGLVQLPEFMLREQVASGQLTEILQAGSPGMSMFMLYGPSGAA